MIVNLRTKAISRELDDLVDRILRCDPDEIRTLQTALREADQTIMREVDNSYRRRGPRWRDDGAGDPPGAA